MGEPHPDDAPAPASNDVPMARREAIDVAADVRAGHAAGLSIDELSGIYGLDRAAVEDIVAAVDADARPRRPRWLRAVASRRRRRPPGDAPRSVAG